MADVRVFPDAEAVAAAFVQHLESLVAARVAGGRPVKVALSGGSTPKRAYELLAKSEIDRSKLELYMVDERYVPPTDERSNEAMMRGALGDTFQFFPMYQPGGVEQAAAIYNELLRERVDNFDVVLLGMGDDGHTASIFPGMWPEETVNAFCVASRAPVVCPERITLTSRAICWAKETIFMVIGEAKAERLFEVLRGRPDFDRLPSQYIHHHSIASQWWVDGAASSLL